MPAESSGVTGLGPVNLKPIIDEILKDYALPVYGDHGVTHWARVLENGLRLSALTDANVAVVTLFAIFHDSRRINECTDPDHGLRGAEFAGEVRNRLFELSNHDFKLLYRACQGHTHERTHPDVTIQTCWDADRLDLGRVGVTPHPSRLCTDAAKDREMIQWADGRATFRLVPSFVSTDWGLEPPESTLW